MVAYAAMGAAGLPETSWAVFSALFVVQASVGGTLGTAFERILGTFAGVAVGVGVLHIADAFDLSTALCIASGVGAMTLLVARYPSLSYGLVTAAIITVTREHPALAGALHKALAIVVGSSAGMVAGLCVLPRSARQTVRERLAGVTREFGALIVDCAQVQTHCGGGERDRVQGSIELSMTAARAMAQVSGLEHPRKLPSQYWSSSQVRAADRVWYSLATLERLSQTCLPAHVCDCLAAPVNDAAQACQARLNAIAEAIEQRTTDRLPEGDSVALDALSQAMETLLAEGHFSTADREQLYAAKWVWRYVHGVIEAFADSLR